MDAPAPDTAQGMRAAARAWTVLGAIVMGYCGSLALMFAQGSWIVDANGKADVTDFLEVWTAGRFALDGAPATAYDWRAHHAAQAALAGHDFHGYLLWSYPPLFLCVAALLAALPYAAAFAGWVVATAGAYAAAIAAIARRREATLAACATPAFFANALVGQNGFLTAALMGSSLLFLERRPILSGIFLGLLTYKPQFGILFPIVLLAGGYWRALASATVTAALTIAVSWALFGTQTYLAFLHFLPGTSQAILGHGGEDWHKMQSIYALARLFGASDASAWIAQGITVAACIAGSIWLWRQKVPFAIKATGLPVAAMLATPYLHMYDFPLLAVSLAFLFRAHPFDRVEWAGIAAANLLFVAFIFVKVPFGPLIVAIVALLVLRRAIGIATPASRMLHRTGNLSLPLRPSN